MSTMAKHKINPILKRELAGVMRRLLERKRIIDEEAAADHFGEYVRINAEFERLLKETTGSARHQPEFTERLERLDRRAKAAMKADQARDIINIMDEQILADAALAEFKSFTWRLDLE